MYLFPLLVVVGLALPVAGCGGPAVPEPTAPATPSTASQSVSVSPYRPLIDPAEFTDRVTNPYFPLEPGTRWVYQGTADGVPQQSVVVVTGDTKTVMGVPCVVVSDVVTSNGDLVEKTVDWYAQDTDGTVWYFGEDTKEYTDGKVSSTHGTWTAGVGGAQPGIVMPAKPRAGMSYRQEYHVGVAEDAAKVLRLDGTVRVPYGAFRNVLVTVDTDALAPDRAEHKWYAAGVGLLEAQLQGSAPPEVTRLVTVTRG